VTTRRSIEIVGGGLAGLSLGLALRRDGVPVTLYEAGRYPRHRVCGEFITGLGQDAIALLKLDPFLASARAAKTLAWFAGATEFRREHLPEPARRISRYFLDASLADAFVAAGGELKLDSRLDTTATPAGRVFCTGRVRAESPWLGLKCHLRNFELSADLELHLGRGGYVGFCAVEGGSINVCGLFRKHVGVNGNRERILSAYLRLVGLNSLADRFDQAVHVPDSWCAVAGMNFSGHSLPTDRIQLGDAHALIAPFTGNGMAMAFQSAAEALGPLVSWARGEREWDTTTQRINTGLRRRFRRRLRMATWVHPFLFSRLGQRCFRLAQLTGLTPSRPWYQFLH
jgi:hypothetical protein